MFRDFTTQKQLKDHVRNTINKIGECNSIKKNYPEEMELFIYLFERHSDYPEKFNGLTDIKIRYNPIYKKQLEAIIVKKNGEEDDVSIFNNCITGKPKDNLTIAMRNSISPQILQFKNTNLQICIKCKNATDIQVDHHKPQFIDLKIDFIENIWKKKLPTNFKQNESHSKIFVEDDGEFEREWFNYHKKNATLRILCKKCNLSRKKSCRSKH